MTSRGSSGSPTGTRSAYTCAVTRTCRGPSWTLGVGGQVFGCDRRSSVGTLVRWRSGRRARGRVLFVDGRGRSRPGLPVLQELLDVRAIPPDRKSSTPRRETGPDGPSSDGEYPSGAAFEARVRLASCRGRRPSRPAGRGPRHRSRTGPPRPLTLHRDAVVRRGHCRGHRNFARAIVGSYPARDESSNRAPAP